MELFPKSPLALMLGGYFAYTGAAIGDEDSSEDLIMTADGDPYDIILASAWTIPLKIYLHITLQDAFSSLPDLPLANMITAQVYLQELEYTNAIRVAESGLELVRRYESNTVRELREYVEFVRTRERSDNFSSIQGAQGL